MSFRVYSGMLCVAFAFISDVSAGPAITNFDWTVNAGFTNWRDSLNNSSGTDQTFIDATPAGSKGGSAAGGSSTTSPATELQWGGGTNVSSNGGASCRSGVCRGGDAGRSGITINNLSAPPAVTTGSSGSTTDLTFTVAEIVHNNQSVFYNSVNLQSASISGNLSMAMPGSATPMSRQFNLDFFKTPNLGTQYGNQLRCASGTAGASGCQDIFAMSLTDYNKSFGKEVVQYNGNEYTFSFLGVDGSGNAFRTLSDEACAQAGLGTGCIGFTTAEGQINTAKIQLLVHIRPLDAPIPEPASIAIIVVGMIGLSFVRKRRYS